MHHQKSDYKTFFTKAVSGFEHKQWSCTMCQCMRLKLGHAKASIKSVRSVQRYAVCTLLCSVINKKRPIKTQIQLEKLVDSEESRNRYYHFGYFRGQKGVIQGYNNNLLLLCAFKRCGLFLLSSFQGTIYLCMKSTIFRLGRKKKLDLWF